MINADPVLVFLVLSITFFGYFLPTIIAWFRNHHQTTAILLLNLFLGWTGLGWCAAIIWAATAIPVKPVASVNVKPEPDQLSLSLS